MLLPRFSLRTTLIGTTGFALFFVVLGFAIRGKPWAIVVSTAIIALAVIFLFHALLYMISQVLARLVGAQQLSARTSQGGVQSSSDQQSPPALSAAEPDSQADSTSA